MAEVQVIQHYLGKTIHTVTTVHRRAYVIGLRDKKRESGWGLRPILTQIDTVIDSTRGSLERSGSPSANPLKLYKTRIGWNVWWLSSHRSLTLYSKGYYFVYFPNCSFSSLFILQYFFRLTDFTLRRFFVLFMHHLEAGKRRGQIHADETFHLFHPPEVVMGVRANWSPRTSMLVGEVTRCRSSSSSSTNFVALQSNRVVSNHGFRSYRSCPVSIIREILMQIFVGVALAVRGSVVKHIRDA